MKEILTRNIGLKILSIILAVLLWLAITNLENPITTKSFRDVQIQILNEDVIAKLGKVYVIKENKTIDFTVSARRKVIEDLTQSDFSVTADFTNLTKMNAVKIEIKCLRYSNDVTFVKGNNEVMKIEMEDLIEKPFKVDVVQKGEPAKGYYVYQKTASTILRVSGPKSKIDSIARIVVEVNVSDAQDTFRIREKPKALNADGNEIDSSNLQFSEPGVYVDIGLHKKKTIDLNVVPKGEPADGYMVSKVEYEPKTIEIAASDDLLQSISNLTVNEDIDKASSSIEKEVNLQELLPEGVVLVGENPTAVVNITIEQEQIKEITLLPSDIEVRNKPLDYKLDYLTLDPITIQVKGPFKQAKMDSLTKDNVKPYIDLTNYIGGTYFVNIGADLPEYMVLENDPKVNIRLMK